MIRPRHVIFIAFLSATAQAFDREGIHVAERHQHKHHHQNGNHQGPRRITSLSRSHGKQEVHVQPPNEATTKPPSQHRHRHHQNQRNPAGLVNQQKQLERVPNEGKQTDTKKPASQPNTWNGQGYQLQRYHLRGENTQVLRFKLSARALPTKDRLTKSDPYVIIYYSDAKEEPEMIMGRTTALTNNEDPTWEEVFTFPYDPNGNQRWHFAIFDRDTHGQDDLIGSSFVKVKYYVDQGQYLKLEVQFDSATRPRDSSSQPLLIIAKE